MNAMNNPIPIPMASLRSIGIALSTASRNPVSTSTETIRPSTTMTPIASGHDSPSAADQGEGHERVEAETCRQRERVLPEEPHGEGHDPGDERSHGQDLRRTGATYAL